MDGVNMTALMGRATKATIRAEVIERKALSFKPVIEIGEEGRMQSFLYRLQPGYFKSVCITCHQKNEEGKDCTFCAEADANMKRDIEARHRNKEQQKLRKAAEKQRGTVSRVPLVVPRRTCLETRLWKRL